MIDPDRWDAPDIGDLAREDPDSLWAQRVARRHARIKREAAERHAEEDKARRDHAARLRAWDSDGRGLE